MASLLDGFRPRRRVRGKIVWDRRTLQAAAVASRTSEGEDSSLVQLHQPWQARAFSYYRKMGECREPAQFVARALAKVRLYAAKGDRDNPEEIESGWAYDLVQQWQKIPEPYGRLKSLIGEGRLCQSVSPEDPGRGVVWEFLSPTELRKEPTGGKIIRRFGKDDLQYTDISNVEGKGDPGPGEMRMWRFWNPHPENSGLADSAFAGVLDYYEQLWWHTLAERADLRNRVANQGILLVPEEIDFEVEGAEEEAMDDDPDVDPFNEKIQRITTAALADPGSAAAASPAVIRAEAEFLKPEVFRHIKFHDPTSSLYVTGREDALLKRISIGLSMPVEEIMGLSISNHWTAWKVDDEKFQAIQPEIHALETDLTEAVLRPIGRASSQPDAEDVFVVVDFAALVSDPDKGQTAIELRKINAVSNEYVREANDVDETAAPDEQDHLEWLAIQLRDKTVAGFEPTAPATAGGDAPPADEEPVSDEEAPPEDDGTDGDPELARRLHTAALIAARASTATFLRSKKRSCPECFETLSADVPDDQFVAVFGPDRLKAVGVREVDLVARMRDGYFKARTLLGDPCDVSVAAAVEAHFAATLLDTNPTDPEPFDRVARR